MTSSSHPSPQPSPRPLPRRDTGSGPDVPPPEVGEPQAAGALPESADSEGGTGGGTNEGQGGASSVDPALPEPAVREPAVREPDVREPALRAAPASGAGGCPVHRRHRDGGAAPGPGSDPDSGSSGSGSGLPKLYDEAFAQDPNALYDKLRSQGGPAQWVELAPGVESILVTGYQACLEVLRSPYFSKDAHRWTALADGDVPPDSPILPIMGPRKSLWFADGQEHLRLRTPVDRALAGIDPHQLRDVVQRSAHRLIDEFAADGEADLVSQYAARIPVMVLAELFGCPDHLNGRITTAFRQMVNAVEPEAATAGIRDLVDCLNELIESKYRTPGDDVTTRLLRHSANVTREELIDQLVVITGAGQVPGTAWISTATMMLLSDDRFAGDLTGGSLTVPDALNEVLWLHAPHSNYSFVYAIEDYVLRDQETGEETPIPAGVPVTISHAAANLDPRLPTSQAQRAVNTAHLAFSAGPHACPAQDTAGVIAEVAVDTLLDRLPEMELAVPTAELTWRPGPFIRALTKLPVRFSPGAGATREPGAEAAREEPATVRAAAGAAEGTDDGAASAAPLSVATREHPDDGQLPEPSAPRRRWSLRSRRGR